MACLGGATACAGGDPSASDRGGGAAPLSASCVDDPSAIPAGAIRCGANATFECADPRLESFYVTAADLGQMMCTGAQVQTDGPSVLTPGDYVLTASEVADAGTTAVCTATVSVVDTVAPTATGTTIEAWPPNHKWLEVTPDACADFEDTCGTSELRFTRVIVDEPVNDRGDGNTEPDVELSCDTVRVRSERQGGGDGRVYRIEFEVIDESMNVTTGTCAVVVPHDQSGAPAVFSAAAYSVEVGDDCEGRGGGDGDCDEEASYDEGLNTGPLPAPCTKIEGGARGQEGYAAEFDGNRATLTGWRTKDDGGNGQFIGFDITLTSTPAWVSVKAGRDVFGMRLDDVLEHSWSHPAGTSGPKAKSISNIVFCGLDACDEDVPPPDVDAGAPDSGQVDASAPLDLGLGF